MLEHPQISQTLKTGYPKPRMRFFGSDIFDSEVLEGDKIVLLPNGEMILEVNLEDYLIENLGFRFEKAK